jgi:hypothetical protein
MDIVCDTALLFRNSALALLFGLPLTPSQAQAVV